MQLIHCGMLSESDVLSTNWTADTENGFIYVPATLTPPASSGLGKQLPCFPTTPLLTVKSKGNANPLKWSVPFNDCISQQSNDINDWNVMTVFNNNAILESVTLKVDKLQGLRSGTRLTSNSHGTIMFCASKLWSKSERKIYDMNGRWEDSVDIKALPYPVFDILFNPALSVDEPISVYRKITNKTINLSDYDSWDYGMQGEFDVLEWFACCEGMDYEDGGLVKNPIPLSYDPFNIYSQIPEGMMSTYRVIIEINGNPKTNQPLFQIDWDRLANEALIAAIN